MSASEVRDKFRDKERAEPWDTITLGPTHNLFIVSLYSTYARSPDNTYSLLVDTLQVECGILYGLGSSYECELRIAVVLAKLLTVEKRQRVKILNLAGNS